MAPTWRFPFAGAPAEEARDDAAGRGSDRFRRARFIPPASANNRGNVVAASAAAPLRRSGSAWDRCRPAAAPIISGTGGLQTLPWRGQSRANSSLKPNSPASWGKYREFCSSGPPRATIVSESRNKFNDLQPNSLRIGTGNLFRPSRELNRPIREFIRLIRESRVLGRDLTADRKPSVRTTRAR